MFFLKESHFYSNHYIIPWIVYHVPTFLFVLHFLFITQRFFSNQKKNNLYKYQSSSITQQKINNSDFLNFILNKYELWVEQKILRFQFIKNDSTVEVEWEHYFPIFLIQEWIFKSYNFFYCSNVASAQQQKIIKEIIKQTTKNIKKWTEQRCSDNHNFFV